MVSVLAALVFSLARVEPVPPPSVPDKASVFGSALLVPTPEGERARTELAVAGEIQASLANLATAHDVHVSVRLAPPCRVIVSLRAAPADVQALEAAVRTVAPALSGCEEAPVLLMAPRAPMPDDASRGIPWPLALSLLSLGVCLGLIVERLRFRVHRNPDDRRRPAR